MFKSGGDRPNTTGLGTYLYASPEQLNSSIAYDYKADVYSLGMVLFEMLHPRFKTKEDRYKIMSEAREKIFNPTFINTISPFYLQLLNKCLQYDPIERPNASFIHSLLKSE